MEPYIPILVSTVVGVAISLITIFVNYKISTHTINTNKNLNSENIKINAENAGKNRIIYEIERYASPQNMGQIKEKLEAGNWTVLNAFSDPGNFSTVIILLGRIK